MENYVMTHCHTTYSIGDSTTQPEDLIAKAKESGMKAICITEHGNCFNWIKKKQLCDKAGIKFIFGIEIYLTKDLKTLVKDNYHSILIAKNLDGVHEINRLIDVMNRDDGHMYYRPRLTFDEFCKISNNVITTSACLGSPLRVLEEEDEWFERLMERYDYLEIQPHVVKKQIDYNNKIIYYSQKYGKELISGTDTHEIDEYHKECRLIYMIGRAKANGEEYYDDAKDFDLSFKTLNEVIEMYKKQNIDEYVYMQALENTNIVADIVEDFKLDTSYKYPTMYKAPFDDLRKYCYERLNLLIANNIISEDDCDKYIDRLEYEMSVFEKLDMGSFMNYKHNHSLECWQNGVPIGPGRGSVTGSLVAYLSQITDVDPMVWGTNFARFCNINRYSLGDIDTDYSPDQRQFAYDLIQRDFTKENSAYIITFQKMKIKSIIDYVCRAIDLSKEEMVNIKIGYDELEKEQQALDKQFGAERISEDEYNEKTADIENRIDEYISQFDNIFYYYKGINGSINAIGKHACFDGDTFINTSSGYKKIKDIDIGDLVLTHKNRYMPVVDVMKNKSNNLLKLNIRRNKIICTENHPFLCMENENDTPKWVCASEIDNKYVAIHKSMFGTELNWNGVYKKVNQYGSKKLINDLTKDRILTKEFMKFCGRFVGDGWVQQHSKRYIVSICCGHDEYNEIIELLNPLGYKYQIKKYKTTYRFTIYQKELAEFLKQFGQGAKNKHLPLWIFNLPEELKMSFLDGYLSADGHNKETYYTWCSVSKELVLNIAMLFTSLYGRPCSYTKDRDEQYNYIENRLVHYNDRYIGAFSKTFSRFYFEKDGYIWIKANIDEYIKKEQDVYNLSVYGDNSYCAENIIVHNCGFIGSPIPLSENIGTFYNKKSKSILVQCDMKCVDSVNYVKYDILGLKTLQVLRETYEMIGKKYPQAHEINWNDTDVFESIGTSPVGLFQFEAENSFSRLRQFQPHTVQDIAFVTAIIRPSCASFIDTAIKKELHKNPTEEIDEILSGTYGYLIYQEQIIAFLQKACGFTEGEADVIRRAIGKKSKELLDEWIPKITEGYIKNSGKEKSIAEKEFNEFLVILMNASNYGFSYNHAIAYSMITYMCAYARHYYPVEFICSYLNNATNDSDIEEGTKLATQYGIEIRNAKFGMSSGRYSVKNGVIYKGIGSILNVSEELGNLLYEKYNSLENKNLTIVELFDTISDIRHDNDSNNISNSKNISTLIRIDYFSDYGKAKMLEKAYDIYKRYINAKIIKKDNIQMSKICRKLTQDGYEGFSETKAQFKVDGRKLVEFIISKLPNEDYTDIERMQHQLSYLNYIQDKDLLVKYNIYYVKYKSKKNGILGLVECGSNKLSWHHNGTDTNIEPDDYIVIYIESSKRNGRRKELYINEFDLLTLDRRKEKKQ